MSVHVVFTKFSIGVCKNEDEGQALKQISKIQGNTRQSKTKESRMFSPITVVYPHSLIFATSVGLFWFHLNNCQFFIVA